VLVHPPLEPNRRDCFCRGMGRQRAGVGGWARAWNAQVPSGKDALACRPYVGMSCATARASSARRASAPYPTLPYPNHVPFDG